MCFVFLCEGVVLGFCLLLWPGCGGKSAKGWGLFVAVALLCGREWFLAPHGWGVWVWERGVWIFGGCFRGAKVRNLLLVTADLRLWRAFLFLCRLFIALRGVGSPGDWFVLRVA